jgi:hypothetical protein
VSSLLSRVAAVSSLGPFGGQLACLVPWGHSSMIFRCRFGDINGL